jgi:UPF0755 protein
MTRFGISPLALIGSGLTVVAVLAATYVIARTPSDVLGGDILAARTPAATGADVAYTLPAGRSAGDVGKDLQKLGVIRSSNEFQMLVTLMGVQDRLSAGAYTLKTGSATASVIDQITVKDAVAVRKVTFPEGIRIEEMAALAEKAGFGSSDAFLNAVANANIPPEIASMLPSEGAVPAPRLQGFLFPDTYILPGTSTPADLVQLMLKTFLLRFTPALQAEAQAHGLAPYQAITLASIIEREAVLEGERPLIAGVFYNRLAAHDLIGADPTVQFAVALDAASVVKYGYWKKELTVGDLENPSLYNTRKVAGLPPGPITNPGLASIKAVAEPTTTKDYYFVADAKKGDGSHVFAETQEQHDRNVAQFGSP